MNKEFYTMCANYAQNCVDNMDEGDLMSFVYDNIMFRLDSMPENDVLAEIEENGCDFPDNDD